LLAADVVAYGDGGGKAPAFPRPVFGRERVVRLFAGLRGRASGAAAGDDPAFGCDQRATGAVFFDPEGQPVLVVSLDIVDDQVQAIRAVSNPDKLSHLRQLSVEYPDT
jgi:RNA polymerase sigma-70 factor (ECF subfamily)